MPILGVCLPATSGPAGSCFRPSSRPFSRRRSRALPSPVRCRPEHPGRPLHRRSLRKSTPDAGIRAAADAVPVSSSAPADASRHTTVVRTADRPAAAKVQAPARPSARAAATTKTAAARPSRAPHTAAPTFHGRNHLWIPGLGISAGVQWFPCSRSRPPGPGVYRWGCAGRNNVYVLGHAWSTLRALHDTYVSGHLRPGLKVWYADNGSHVHEYSVAWWRVVAPTTAASWAWAAQSRPSMTLQTCVGANSQYRLMVRLVEVR